MTLTGRDQPERVEIVRASSTLLQLFGAHPLAGRLFTAEDDASGKPPVALLTQAVWKRLFNGDPGIVGRSIVLNGTSIPVAGILRPEFLFNHEVVPTVAGIEKADILISLPLAADAQQKQRGDENYNLLARLKPGVTFAAAQADVDAIAARIRAQDKRDRTFTISVVPLEEQVVGSVKRSLLGAARVGGAGAVDRVRECRQPAALARGGTAEGSRDPHRAGRRRKTGSTAAADRERAAGPVWRRRRDYWSPRAGLYAAARDASRKHSAAGDHRARWRRPGIHLRDFDRHRRRVRPGAGAARGRPGPEHARSKRAGAPRRARAGSAWGVIVCAACW